MRDVAQHHSHVEEIKENESENGVYDESISGDVVPQSTIHCTVEDGISHHITLAGSWTTHGLRVGKEELAVVSTSAGVGGSLMSERYVLRLSSLRLNSLRIFPARERRTHTAARLRIILDR